MEENKKTEVNTEAKNTEVKTIKLKGYFRY